MVSGSFGVQEENTGRPHSLLSIILGIIKHGLFGKDLNSIFMEKMRLKEARDLPVVT